MTKILAHRGASAYAPENTLPAFELALEQGADGFELDVHLTKDGKIVVIHDETVERTSNGEGRIVDLTLDELRAFDFSAGMGGYANSAIPTLREVLDLVVGTDALVNIELKNTIEPYPDLAQDLDALVASMNLAGQVIYSTFNHYSVRDMIAAGTPVPVGILHSDMLVEPWDYAVSLGAQALHPHYGLVAVNGDYVPQAHEAGLRVNVWTVNDPGHMAMMLRDEVDAIITNHPDVAVALRG
jgi:glycerophosphoryl diester phosphodiesterase